MDVGAGAQHDIVNVLPMALVVVDGDGRIVHWNAAAEILYGHSRDDVLGAPVVDLLFDDDDRAEAAARFEGLATSGGWEGDCRVRRRDGALLVSSFRLAPMGSAGGAAWIATDRTDQGLAEQERAVLLSAEHAARATAEEALALVEAIVSSAPVGIAVFDVELRYVRLNDAYASLIGVPAAELTGQTLGDGSLLGVNAIADLRRVITTGRTIVGRKVEVGDSEDPADNRHFHVSYFPVCTAGGVLAGAGLTLAEVTDAHRAEAERLALLRRAEAAQLRLSVLATASTVLTTTMDLDELLTRLTRVLTPVAADWCVIELFGARGEVEHVAVSHRDRKAAAELARVLPVTRVDGDGPLARVLRTGQACGEPSSTLGELLRVEVGPGETRIYASVVAPIEARGQVFGALVLANDRDQDFDDDDVDLAVEVAHRAALAVGNARAFQQEHQIAETLQRALLPTALPSVPGLDVAVRYLVATDGAAVGGDWYDVMAFDDRTTGLVVGDVVGHDIAASTSMGQLRSVLRAYAHEDHTGPGTVLARIARRLDSLGLSYSTCVFGILDMEAPSFRWSNAGHPPPLLVRAGVATFLTEGAGIMLGASDGSAPPDGAVTLDKGDLLILYTDGLVEKRGESLEAGLARLAHAASAMAVDDAGAVCDVLLAAMAPPGGTRDDDVAILVARVRGDATDENVHRMPFATEPSSAALTRGFTAGVLQGAGWADQTDAAVLLVSELVTNAVRHARGPCALVVTLRDDEVEVAVEDGDPRVPAPRPGEPLDDGGRGFLLVEALADDWGVRQLPGGKATWFVLRP